MHSNDLRFNVGTGRTISYLALQTKSDDPIFREWQVGYIHKKLARSFK